jgi:hypothetical protein
VGTVSIQCYRHMATRQNSKLVPGGLDFLRLAFVHQSMALRHQWQCTGQLHALLGGDVTTCFSFGFLPCSRAHVLGGPAAVLSCSNASSLGLNGGTREEVVRSGDVRPRRVATVQLRVSLQEVLQLSNGVIEVVFSKRSRILTGLGGFRAENNVGTYGTASTSSSTR